MKNKVQILVNELNNSSLRVVKKSKKRFKHKYPMVFLMMLMSFIYSYGSIKRDTTKVSNVVFKNNIKNFTEKIDNTFSKPTFFAKCKPAKGLYHKNVSATRVTLGITDIVTCSGKFNTFSSRFVIGDANGNFIRAEGVTNGLNRVNSPIRVTGLYPSRTYTYWFEKVYTYEVKKTVNGRKTIKTIREVVRTDKKRFTTKAVPRCPKPTGLISNIKPDGKTYVLKWDAMRNARKYSIQVINASGKPNGIFIKSDGILRDVKHPLYGRKKFAVVRSHCVKEDYSYYSPWNWKKAVVIGAGVMRWNSRNHSQNIVIIGKPKVNGLKVIRTSGGYVFRWDKSLGNTGYVMLVRDPRTGNGQVVRRPLAFETDIFFPFSIMPKNTNTWDFYIKAKYGSRGASKWSRHRFGKNGAGLSAAKENSKEAKGISKPLLNETTLIYPNPSNGNFNLSFNKKEIVHSITIYDLQGRALFHKDYNKKLDNKEYRLNTTLKSGMYKIKVSTQENIEYKTIIVR